jgi:hypothetical protein
MESMASMEEAAVETRRHVLSRLAGVAAAVLAASGAVSGLLRAQRASPQPLPSPNAPMNQNVPGGLDGAGLAHQSQQPTISPLVWSEIKSDSDKLLQMATDFKAKIDQTNVSATLSLPLMKEAHQIEKMAKQIQQRMRS